MAATSVTSRFGKGLALLSLDGGGVRGLSSLYILQRLMEQIDPEDPPKPCDCFDLIGGTSTGGLIALMLGRLGMTVQECIDAYTGLMPAVFQKTKHRLSMTSGKLQGRFSSKGLEDQMKGILDGLKIDKEEVLKNPTSTCKTFVCVTRKRGPQTTLFSTYPNPRRSTHLYNAVKIWEAARATSAATTFFEPIKIVNEEFVDGAFGANNPIDEIWTEAIDIWMKEPGDRLEDHISCFVSIGTGIPAFGEVGDSIPEMFKTLQSIATSCEAVAEKFRRQHRSLEGRFFRFNVLRGLEGIGLEAANKHDLIVTATRQYLESQASLLEIERFQSAMLQRQRTSRIYKFISDISSQEIVHIQRQKLGAARPHNITAPWITNTNNFDQFMEPECTAGLHITWKEEDNDASFSTSSVTGIANAMLSASARHRRLHLVSTNLGNFVRQSVRTKVPNQAPEDDNNGAMQRFNVKELIVVCSCLVLSSNLIGEYLLRHISELPESYLEVLESVASYHATSRQYRADRGDLLKKTSYQGLRDLFRNAANELQPNTLLLVSLHNTEHIDPFDLNSILVNMCFFDLTKASLKFVCHASKSPVTERLDSDLWFFIDRQTEYNDCLESLKVSRAHARMNQISSSTTGTFRWLNLHPSFQNWEAEGGVLWIRGKPGSGKSTLAKQILTEVLKNIPNVVPAAWFYSIKLEAIHRSHVSMLRNLLYSFLQQKESLFHEHVEHYRRTRTPGRHWEWTREALEALLRSICATSSSPNLIAVIDALDEAEDVDETALYDHASSFFLGLSDLERSRIRFVVLSRPYRSLQRAFRFCEHIHLEQETDADMVKVVDEGLEWLRHTIDSEQFAEDNHGSSHPGVLRRKRRQLRTRTAHTYQTTRARDSSSILLDAEFRAMREFLITHSNGVFLWVTLVLKELHQISKTPLFDVRDLKRCLFNLPSELEDLYAVIAGRLNIHGLERTRQILVWTIGTSERMPLTLAMLHDALGIEEEADLNELLQSAADPFWPCKPLLKSWWSFSVDVYEHCGGFVDIVPPSKVGKPFQDFLDEDVNEEWIVTLLHRTTLDFLITQACPPLLQINTQLAQSIVERSLMVYLQVYLPLSGKGPSFFPRLFETRIASRDEPSPVLTSSDVPTIIANDLDQLHSSNTPTIVVDEVDQPLSSDCFEPNPSFTAKPEVVKNRGDWSESTTGVGENHGKIQNRRPTHANEPFRSMFQKTDHAVLAYLEDRRLLCFALQSLRTIWDRPEYINLANYKNLLNGHTNDADTWPYWLHGIPGSFFLAACEQEYSNALQILDNLFTANDEARDKAGLAMCAAVAMFCSRHGLTDNLHTSTLGIVTKIARQYSSPNNYTIMDDLVTDSARYSFRDLIEFLIWQLEQNPISYQGRLRSGLHPNDNLSRLNSTPLFSPWTPEPMSRRSSDCFTLLNSMASWPRLSVAKLRRNADHRFGGT